MTPSSQEYVGSYRLLTILRTGKTCQVWEVMNDLTSERLAMKLLTPEYLKNADEVGYLKHEFEVAQKFDHPNVIHIYKHGAKKTEVYLAMELYAAPNIKQVIQQGYEYVAPIADLVIENAAKGLAYFHSHGWIHRDIKPDNFLMNAEGDVKLIDFALAVREKRGLAKLFARPGKVQGTRSYMSPEQIRSLPLTLRADMYSFGCMIFELVGGRVPFTGVSTNDLLMKHLRTPAPALASLNRNVTEDFADLVKRMLAKDPAARPATMDDFLREFRSLRIYKKPPRIEEEGEK